MKILLGNNTLSYYQGSETWTYTLALALKKAGHDVSCFSPTIGELAKDLEKNGIHCFSSISKNGIKPFSIVLEPEANHNYDFIIAAHWHIVEMLREEFPITPIVSVIHGVIHKTPDGTEAPEHPSLRAGVNQFVAVSEEVQQVLKDEYNIDSLVIRNFIDIERFPKMPVNETPRQLLINSNYVFKNSPEVQVVREVAQHYGARLAAIGQNFTITSDVKKAMQDADIVFGYGRSILEGLACGRLCFVHGHLDTGHLLNRGTGGVITEGTVEDLRAVNFSGRNAQGVLWTKEQFIEAIDTFYKPDVLEWGPAYVARNHNAILAAMQFVEIGRSLLGQDIVPEDAPRPLKRAPDNIYGKRS